jgi:hypothetical protein
MMVKCAVCGCNFIANTASLITYTWYDDFRKLYIEDELAVCPNIECGYHNKTSSKDKYHILTRKRITEIEYHSSVQRNKLAGGCVSMQTVETPGKERYVLVECKSCNSFFQPLISSIEFLRSKHICTAICYCPICERLCIVMSVPNYLETRISKLKPSFWAPFLFFK